MKREEGVALGGLECGSIDIYSSVDKYFLMHVFRVQDTLLLLSHWISVWLDGLDFLLSEKWCFIMKIPAVNVSYRVVSVAVMLQLFIAFVINYVDDNDDAD